MKDKYFIDTNVILYSFDKKSPQKKKIAEELIYQGLKNSSSRLSMQVLQEFTNVAIKQNIFASKTEHLILYLKEILLPQCEILTNYELIEEAILLRKSFTLSFCDSLIIAGAQKLNCKIIYTEDMHHDIKIGNLKIINPFK